MRIWRKDNWFQVIEGDWNRKITEDLKWGVDLQDTRREKDRSAAANWEEREREWEA